MIIFDSQFLIKLSVQYRNQRIIITVISVFYYGFFRVEISFVFRYVQKFRQEEGGTLKKMHNKVVNLLPQPFFPLSL